MRYGIKTKYEALQIKDRFKLGEHHGLCLGLQELVQLAKYHHTLQEHSCNGELTLAQMTRESNIEKRMATIAHHLGLKIHFDGDPRGYTVKISQTGDASCGYGVGQK